MLNVFKGLLRLIATGAVLQTVLGIFVLSKVTEELRASGDDSAQRSLPKFRDKQDELDWANRRGRWKDQ